MSDLHTHTRYSHGTGTPAQNVRAALDRGVSVFAVSEHGPAHLFYGVRGKRLAALRAELDALQACYDDRIRVLKGIECNLTGFGKCDLPPDMDFDVKLLGFHKGVLPQDACGWRLLFESLGLGHNDPVETANALLAAAETYKIGILSHPGLYVKADIDTLARGAAELGVLLELNGSHPSLSVEEVRRAAELGARFCLNSDAHCPENVANVARARAVAEAAGITWEG